MFQIMPKTAAELGVANPFDPVEAARRRRHAPRPGLPNLWKLGACGHGLQRGAAPHRRTYLAGDGPPLKQETLDYLPKVEEALRRVNANA